MLFTVKNFAFLTSKGGLPCFLINNIWVLFSVKKKIYIYIKYGKCHFCKKKNYIFLLSVLNTFFAWIRIRIKLYGSATLAVGIVNNQCDDLEHCCVLDVEVSVKTDPRAVMAVACTSQVEKKTPPHAPSLIFRTEFLVKQENLLIQNAIVLL